MARDVYKRQVYDIDQVRQILAYCADNRDRAFIHFMVDSGLRNAEVRALNWVDVDLASGIVSVKCGKGRKLSLIHI